MSWEAADGGGQTLSWKMDPDSEARARSRRGGVNDEGGDKSEGTGTGVEKVTCARECDGDCERENE
jgi:hypothetical protein